MKKLTYISIVLLTLLAGCTDREYDDLLSVKPLDFDLSLAAYNKEIYFNEQAKLHLKLKPEFISHSKPNQYKIKYQVSGGTGNFIFRDSIYTSGQTIVINHPNFPVDDGNIYFVPTATVPGSSAYKIELLAEDLSGTVKTVEETINIKQRDFTFLATNDPYTKLFIEESKGVINLKIEVTGNAGGMGYKLTPTVSGGVGKFFYKNKEYAIGDAIPVDTGNSQLQYMPTTYGDGTHKITLTLKDATHQTKTQMVSFKIYKNPEINSVSIYRKHRKWSCNVVGNCDYETTYWISYNITLDESATLETIIVSGKSRLKGASIFTKVVPINGGSTSQELYKFFYENYGGDSTTWGNGDPVSVEFIDSNGKSTKMEKIPVTNR